MESAERRISSVSPREEAGFIVAAQNGDAAAFGRLVKLYQRAIYRLAYGLTRSTSDADDLAQETFVRAYQAIGRFRVGEPVYPWLARIAVNLTYSLFRSRKRRPETALEPLIEAGRQFAGDDNPAERAERSERDAHLAEALAGMTEEHRTILVLRVVQDMSYEQIAQTLKVPAGTVMSRLSRARVELRGRMKARSGEE
jgi:RNA polymerase sigma-70 factor, ECF subfamily